MMSVKKSCSTRDSARLQSNQAAGIESWADSPLSVGHPRERACQVVVRLIVELERGARAEIPIAERFSLLQDLKPKVIRTTSRLPKPVASARQLDADGTAGQTLEQRLDRLMAKNLQLAFDDLGRSGLAYSDGYAKLRSWLVRNIFQFVGRQLDYAVRWNKPYPPGAWGMLHELYFDLGARKDVSPGLSVWRGRDAFDPENEYKRLLLLGLVGQLVRPADRSYQLFDALASLASGSRLQHPASYSGAFGIYVVEIAQDEPPRVSGALDYGFNGWVFEPNQMFLDLVGSRRIALA